MSDADRKRWDEKHERASTSPFGEPEFATALIPPATGRALALDVACGRGRNCRVLLDRGYSVVAVDISSAALRGIKETYKGAEDRVRAVQADLDLWPFDTNRFDLILQCNFLDRRLFPRLKASTRPGGFVLIDTFGSSERTASGPRNPEFRLTPGELVRAFVDWEILHVGSRKGIMARETILARKRTR